MFGLLQSRNILNNIRLHICH